MYYKKESEKNKLVIFYFHISHILLPYYTGKYHSKDINLDKSVCVYSIKQEKKPFLHLCFFLVYDSFCIFRQTLWLLSLVITICLLMINYML